MKDVMSISTWSRVDQVFPVQTQMNFRASFTKKEETDQSASSFHAMQLRNYSICSQTRTNVVPYTRQVSPLYAGTGRDPLL